MVFQIWFGLNSMVFQIRFGLNSIFRFGLLSIRLIFLIWFGVNSMGFLFGLDSIRWISSLKILFGQKCKEAVRIALKTTNPLMCSTVSSLLALKPQKPHFLLCEFRISCKNAWVLNSVLSVDCGQSGRHWSLVHFSALSKQVIIQLGGNHRSELSPENKENRLWKPVFDH